MSESSNGVGFGRTSVLATWRGTALIAATYIYFLLFAQFIFLGRLDELGLSQPYLKAVMAAMAAGGIVGSLVAWRLIFRNRPVARVRVGMAGCALAAVASRLSLGVAGASAVAVAIGLSLGVLTVTLVAELPLWTAYSNPLIKVALGTGLGYFFCNIPLFFTAGTAVGSWTVAAICCAALLATPALNRETQEWSSGADGAPPFLVALVWFTALIWFDSAAFFIIQSSPALKAGTWAGTVHLWRNAVLHLMAAVGSALLLRRKGLTTTLATAFACLAGASLLLNNPLQIGTASVLYPIGVSLYSVALVAAPAFLLRSHSREERYRRTGLLYAVAGWVGSGLGIGMAQNLHRVPVLFVALAGGVFVGMLLLRIPKIWVAPAVTVIVLIPVSYAVGHFLAGRGRSELNEVQKGREVYIAEGCIHCHSQYVRPRSEDTLLWGPAQDVEVIRRQKPPLIGNRRQGPDLSEVGARRSPLWMRMHFYNPRVVSYDSIMPSYRHLFANSRGEDLIAYLQSLRTPGSVEHIRAEMDQWHPSKEVTGAGAARGKVLFGDYCATCHSPSGAARQRWGATFRVKPPDLGRDRLPDVEATSLQSDRDRRLEAIIKFGLPGTDMPGHEYLPDADVISVAEYVESMRAQTTSDRPK